MVQKFVPWSRVGIFHNKPLDPPYRTLTSCFGAFCTIWEHLGQFGCVTTLCVKWTKLVQKSVPRSRFGILSQRMHLIHPHCTLNTCFGVFCTIWMYLEPFGCLTKLSAKRAELVQKFVPWSRVGIFHNEPLNPPHWTLTSCFRAFCTTWVHLWQFGSFTTLSTKWAKFFRN